MYGNNVLNYLLWMYEGEIQNRWYMVNQVNVRIENEQIEHISPQNPTNWDPLETGYDVDENNEYSEEFILKQLNCIGNLMLISGSHNASIWNKPFNSKLESYRNNPLLNQQNEIKDFYELENDLPVWKSNSIIKRQKKIIDFSVKKWDFDSIIIKELD